MLLVLAGCAATDDPAEGGFFTGMANLSSGAYEERLDRKRGELDAAQTEHARLEEHAAGVERDRAAVSAELAAAEQRLAVLRADMDDLDRRIEDASAGAALDQQELNRLNEELADLKQSERLLATDPVVGIDAKAKRIDELERRKKVLEETLAKALAR